MTAYREPHQYFVFDISFIIIIIVIVFSRKEAGKLPGEM